MKNSDVISNCFGQKYRGNKRELEGVEIELEIRQICKKKVDVCVK